MKTAAACTLGSSFELAPVIVDVEQLLEPSPRLWVFVAVNVKHQVAAHAGDNANVLLEVRRKPFSAFIVANETLGVRPP